MSVTPRGSGHRSPAREKLAGSLTTSGRRILFDRLGSVSVTLGGLLIIASILGILLFIVVEVWPLTSGAKVTRGEALPLPSAPSAMAMDEYRETALLLDAEGQAIALDLEGGRELERLSVKGPEDPPFRGVQNARSSHLFLATAGDSRLWLIPYRFETRFEGQIRTILPGLGNPEIIEIPVTPECSDAVAAVQDGEGSLTAATACGGTLNIIRRQGEENFLTGEVEWQESRYEGESPRDVNQLLMAEDQSRIFGVSGGRNLVLWTLEQGEPSAPMVFPADGARVTALALLLGDEALVVGREDGSIEIWFLLRKGAAGYELTRVRGFDGQDSAITSIVPSRRNKGFLAADAGGTVALYYSTSDRLLWVSKILEGAPAALELAPKADGALLARGKQAVPLTIDNPHPEVSWKALFGKVWYEGYDRPKYVWQSSSGTDDFEPKLSLVPLLVGTLKGTFYSLILAIPLGVFGAMYTSHFLHPTLKRFVKPLVEIMAALPSVVLGFLAGLWLAPRLEQGFATLILACVLIPAALMGTGLAWGRMPRTLRHRLLPGTEVALFAVVILVTALAAHLLAGPFEALAFGGSFTQWLVDTTGVAYDQRNAVVVGLAMGFAVIPIIFSVSEDAFSNVPRNLVSGSLALGANRWQTVTRVVLPTASPGIFSAIMIGFGRAVGETMIVLMATGNTPIMEWNPFNGFRTLSANIAVEIPEAPFGGTLYRTLFLSALLLFFLTFVVNTAAELVRHRLRRRYANL